MIAPAPTSLPTEAPARVTLRPLEPAGTWLGVPAQHLELVSRGDIVNGVLARGQPASKREAKSALLLLAHDAGSSATSGDWSPVAHWISPAIAVAAVDLPLHGHRASAKLSERLISSTSALARGASFDPNGRVLVEEFLRQATSDLTRTLDALLALGEFDPKRVGFLGLGLGAWVGQVWLPREDRITASVLGRAAPAPGKPPPPFPSLGSEADGAPASRPSEVLTVGFDRHSKEWSDAAREFLASKLAF